MLSAACSCFDDLFSTVASEDRTDSVLPHIPLFEMAQTIAHVLPLAYRQSAQPLRSLPFQQLVDCLKLADKLGMPLAVDAISMYLEAQ